MAAIAIHMRSGVAGQSVQVDPIKPTLKAPETKRLKLKHDELLSILLQFCFQIHLAPLYRGRRHRRHHDRQRRLRLQLGAL
jgi:hypothetical protein